ncbi:hypothetical protein GGI25_002629 [Coemansia spiralis]|uniref:Protein SYM1 n=2 Tax=Coemansia TaxID=4863 RepID=A0A9W8KYC1_9FUNG|nr:hypothetical protein BX070DRAFT_225708 [Coemansia spiralis]KAJ1989815.1 hypothetical protein EDC05_004435 [Coemansia umbellata]KAJ2620606.1 hypothetical protein GGI26_004838 [Coemansia sp. RSA 1358]KAJ2678125.1 hypothetical protein GGI25_002629 [Coemansia spiralis]
MTGVRLLKLGLFSGSVSATGNMIAQYLDLWSGSRKHAKKELPETKKGFAMAGFDPVQTLRFFVYGFLFTQISYRWHVFLNGRFPVAAAATPSTSQVAQPASIKPTTGKAAMVLKRVAFDQIIFAPFASGMFVVGMGILEGQGPEKLLERIQLQYTKILIAGYAVWPAAQLINFSLIPLAYRVPFGSIVSLFWNTYLSWENAHAKRKQAIMDAEKS